MLQPIINNSLLVELNLDTLSVGQRYAFADEPQLRAGTAFITGVEAFTSDQVSTSLNQNAIVPVAANFTVVFAVRETEYIQNIPYYTLVSSLNGGFIRMLNNKQINLSKSYAICNNVTGLTAGQSLLFNFYYTDAKAGRK